MADYGYRSFCTDRIAAITATMAFEMHEAIEPASLKTTCPNLFCSPYGHQMGSLGSWAAASAQRQSATMVRSYSLVVSDIHHGRIDMRKLPRLS